VPGFYGDNSGTVTGTVTVVGAPVEPVPGVDLWALTVLAAGLTLVSVRFLRRLA